MGIYCISTAISKNYSSSRPRKVFKRNKNVKEIICINPTENGEVKKPINPFVQQKCCPCLANCLLPLANSLLVASTISINIQEPKKKWFTKYSIMLIWKVNAWSF